MITISKHLANECGEALVSEYNNKYDKLSQSCRKVDFRCLYRKLKELQCEHLIASAKGDQEVRDYGFKQ